MIRDVLNIFEKSGKFRAQIWSLAIGMVTGFGKKITGDIDNSSGLRKVEAIAG